MQKVKAADIYKDIIRDMGMPETHQESELRNMRNKMKFLIEQVAYVKTAEYKEGRDILIPACDEPIVRNLIKASLSDDFPSIRDWFNGSLCLNDAQNCMLLSMEIKEPILRALIIGETDSVTVDEWIGTINGIINANMAECTIKIKRKLENYRVNTLVRDSTVQAGSIICSNEDGHRAYAVEGEHNIPLLDNDLLARIVDGLNVQRDYFSVLDQIIDYMMKDAEQKAVSDIEAYAVTKAALDIKSAKDIIENTKESMVSEYIPWYKKIADFLKRHPEIAKKIELETETTDLVEFFNVRSDGD